MNRKMVSRFVLISSIGLGGYLSGTYNERRKLNEKISILTESDPYFCNFGDKFRQNVMYDLLYSLYCYSLLITHKLKK